MPDLRLGTHEQMLPTDQGLQSRWGFNSIPLPNLLANGLLKSFPESHNNSHNGLILVRVVRRGDQPAGL
jgi:hypothetical protein